MSFARNLSEKYGEKIIEYRYKNRNRSCKNCFQKVVPKTAEATRELIGNKITEKVLKPKPVPDESSRNAEEVVIPPE